MQLQDHTIQQLMALEIIIIHSLLANPTVAKNVIFELELHSIEK